MKVLLVNNHARITGGADVHCFELARLLSERGHDVRFLSTQHPQNIVAGGAFVPQIVSRSSRDELGAKAAARVAMAACWNPTAAAATERLIADFAPDVVHSHKLYPQLSVAPVVVAARHSVPVVQTAHDYEFISASIIDDRGRSYDRDEERLAYRLLNSLLFRIKRVAHVPRIATWITVSRDVAGLYRERARIESRPLPNFVAPDKLEPVPFSQREGALWVGRLATEKGLDDVIELARRLPELPVTIAGLGPLAGAMEGAAAMVPNLHFAGELSPEEVASRMRTARLLVLPSAWREPAGLVALEAMRAGTPIVAYDRGGLAEYVADAGAGTTVPPHLEALTTAVAGLLVEPTTWRRYSAAGLAASRTTHDPDIYMDALESVYAEAAARSGNPN
jgi:glycosyltransferase involved in cell wall biosynthesis